MVGIEKGKLCLGGVVARMGVGWDGRIPPYFR